MEPVWAGKASRKKEISFLVTVWTYFRSNSLTGVTSYEYDKNKNVTKTTDAMGNSTSYAYDKLGRVISETNALICIKWINNDWVEAI